MNGQEMVKAIIKKIAKDDDLGLNKATVFFQLGPEGGNWPALAKKQKW